jgi:hypothetical protein
MISIQELRKQEQAELEARRQREFRQRNQVRGFNYGDKQVDAPQKEGVLKFARFLYES